VAGSRHASELIVAGLTGGNEQYWVCRQKSIRFRMLQGWMVSRIHALIFSGIMKTGVYTYIIKFLDQELKHKAHFQNGEGGN